MDRVDSMMVSQTSRSLISFAKTSKPDNGCALNLVTQCGYGSDNPRVRGDVEMAGVAVHEYRTLTQTDAIIKLL